MKSTNPPIIVIIAILGVFVWVLLFALGKKESDSYKLPEVETKENQTEKRKNITVGASVLIALFVAFIAFKTYKKS